MAGNAQYKIKVQHKNFLDQENFYQKPETTSSDEIYTFRDDVFEVIKFNSEHEIHRGFSIDVDVSIKQSNLLSSTSYGFNYETDGVRTVIDWFYKNKPSIVFYMESTHQDELKNVPNRLKTDDTNDNNFVELKFGNFFSGYVHSCIYLGSFNESIVADPNDIERDYRFTIKSKLSKLSDNINSYLYAKKAIVEPRMEIDPSNYINYAKAKLNKQKQELEAARVTLERIKTEVINNSNIQEHISNIEERIDKEQQQFTAKQNELNETIKNLDRTEDTKLLASLIRNSKIGLDSSMSGTGGITFREIVEAVLYDNELLEEADYRFNLARFMELNGNILSPSHIIQGALGNSTVAYYTMLDEPDYDEEVYEPLTTKYRLKVQKNESDLDFITRLSESEGVSFLDENIEVEISGEDSEFYEVKYVFYDPRTAFNDNKSGLDVALKDKLSYPFANKAAGWYAVNSSYYELDYNFYNPSYDITFKINKKQFGNNLPIGTRLHLTRCVIADKNNQVSYDVSPAIKLSSSLNHSIPNPDSGHYSYNIYFPAVYSGEKLSNNILSAKDANVRTINSIASKSTSTPYSVVLANYSDFTDQVSITNDYAPLLSAVYYQANGNILTQAVDRTPSNDYEGISSRLTPEEIQELKENFEAEKQALNNSIEEKEIEINTLEEQLANEKSENNPDDSLIARLKNDIEAKKDEVLGFRAKFNYLESRLKNLEEGKLSRKDIDSKGKEFDSNIGDIPMIPRSKLSGQGTAYYYNETFDTQQEANRKAVRRMEMLKSNSDYIECDSFIIDMIAGSRVFIDDKDNKKTDGNQRTENYYVFKVNAQGYNQNVYNRRAITSSDSTYSNKFKAIVANKLVFRPDLRIEIPKHSYNIPGIIKENGDSKNIFDTYFFYDQNGNKKGVNMKYQEVDKYGRHRVEILGIEFRNVLKAKNDKRDELSNYADPGNQQRNSLRVYTTEDNETTIKLRKSQFYTDGLSEGGFGIALPVGTEVVIGFFDANIDRPYIVGGVLRDNVELSSLLELSSKQGTNYIRTPGGSGLYLSDQNNSEKVVFETSLVDFDDLVVRATKPINSDNNNVTEEDFNFRERSNYEDYPVIDANDLSIKTKFYKASNYIDVLKVGDEIPYGLSEATEGFGFQVAGGGIKSIIATKPKYEALIRSHLQDSSAPVSSEGDNTLRSYVKSNSENKNKAYVQLKDDVYSFSPSSYSLINDFGFIKFGFKKTSTYSVEDYYVADVTQPFGDDTRPRPVELNYKEFLDEQKELAQNMVNDLKQKELIKNDQVEAKKAEILQRLVSNRSKPIEGSKDVPGSFYRVLGDSYIYREGIDYEYHQQGTDIRHFGNVINEHHINFSDVQLLTEDQKNKYDSAFGGKYNEAIYNRGTYGNTIVSNRYLGNKIDFIDGNVVTKIGKNRFTVANSRMEYIYEGGLKFFIGGDVNIDAVTLFHHPTTRCNQYNINMKNPDEDYIEKYGARFTTDIDMNVNLSPLSCNMLTGIIDRRQILGVNRFIGLVTEVVVSSLIKGNISMNLSTVTFNGGMNRVRDGAVESLNAGCESAVKIKGYSLNIPVKMFNYASGKKTGVTVSN